MREALLAMAECSGALMAAARCIEQAERHGRFDFMSGDDAAEDIALTLYDAAPNYLTRSRLRRKGAR
jgi:hypothetical protein